MRSDLQALHYKLYERLQKEIKAIEGEQSTQLLNYKKEFSQFSKQPYKISHSQELLKSIKNSQIIYLGDFHTFDQSSKNLQRILTFLLESQECPILAMEMIDYKHQNFIDAYIAGDITELEFLESIEYRNSWRFPWGHYRYFFQMAKKKNLKIIGLNSKGGLSERDFFASVLLSQVIHDFPQEKILVLFGELHIMPNKIPLLVKQQFLQGSIRDTIIQQNIDQVYWHNPQAKIIKFSENTFSIQTSPPWTKYDSQLYWYDHLCDDPSFDLHEYVREVSLMRLSEYSNDTFASICGGSSDAFGFGDNDLQLADNFTLMDSTKLESLHRKIEKKYGRKESLFFKDLLATNQLIRFPDTSVYYAPSYSLNRLAYLAGMHLLGSLFNRHIATDKNILKEKCEVKFLYFFHMALWGYMGAKIYNPFRKCDLYLDLVGKIQANHPDKPYIELAMNILTNPQQLVQYAKKQSLHSLYYSANILGHSLGDCLFRALEKNNEMKSFAFFSWNFSFSHMDLILIKDIISDSIDYKKERKRFF